MTDRVDTTGIIVDSYEAGMEHLRNYPLRTEFYPGFYYCLLMLQDDGSHKVVERNSMPCWGALREYEAGNRADDPWPEDLRTERHLFPEGKPVALSVCMSRNFRESNRDHKSHYSWDRTNTYTPEKWNTFIEFVTNKEVSPWRSVLNNFSLIKNDDGVYWGFVTEDTNVDPNVLINMFRANFFANEHAINFYQYTKDHPEVDPRIAYIKCSDLDSYFISGRFILKNWFTGVPDIPCEGTFYERTSYNRPDASYVWGGKGNRGVSAKTKDLDYLNAELAASVA